MTTSRSIPRLAGVLLLATCSHLAVAESVVNPLLHAAEQAAAPAMAVQQAAQGAVQQMSKIDGLIPKAAPAIPAAPVPVDAAHLPPPFPDKKITTEAPEEDPVVTNYRDDQLSPESIIAIRKIILDARRGKMMPIEGRFQAKAVNRVLYLDMSPGAVPPIIRIGDHQGCSITFSDANGKEWPMLNYTNFTPAVATINRPVEGASLITIEPKDTSGMGNVAVYLKGPNDEVVPISFTVLMEQKEADYVVSAVVPRILSNDKTTSVSSSTGQKNESLELALAGISPPNSIKLVSSDDRVEAWKIRRDNKTNGIILRSKATLIAPAPLFGRKMTSRDGTKAYEVDPTPIVTILSGGTSQMVTLTEKEK